MTSLPLAPVAEPFERDGLVLRRLHEDDIQGLLAHFSQAKVTEFMDMAPLASEDEAREIVTWANAIFRNGRGVRWSIRDGEGRFLGTCGFHGIERELGSRADIAYDLSPQHWGRGLMTATILPFLLETGFETLELHRLQAFVTPGNARSVRLLERFGFRHEGRLRDHGAWRGAFWDQDVHALLQDEWSGSNRGR